MPKYKICTIDARQQLQCQQKFFVSLKRYGLNRLL